MAKIEIGEGVGKRFGLAVLVDQYHAERHVGVAQRIEDWPMKFLKAPSGRVGAATLVMLLSTANGALAATYCQDAIDSYNTAISDVSSEIANYTRCLSSSQGEDDCSRKFRSLRSAQGEFEDAVNDIRQECEN